MLHELVYISREVECFSLDTLTELLHRVRPFNSAHNISGILLYKNGHFIQTLEGDKEVILKLFERIKHDPRHSSVTLLHLKPKKERAFDGWSMSIKVMDDRYDQKSLDAFNDFMNPSNDNSQLKDKDKEIHTLLQLFKEHY